MTSHGDASGGNCAVRETGGTSARWPVDGRVTWPVSCKPWSLPSPGYQGAVYYLRHSPIDRNDKEASVYGFVGAKWIERITGVYEASITAVGQLFFQLLDGLTNHAERRAGLELVLDLDK